MQTRENFFSFLYEKKGNAFFVAAVVRNHFADGRFSNIDFIIN